MRTQLTLLAAFLFLATIATGPAVAVEGTPVVFELHQALGREIAFMGKKRARCSRRVTRRT